MLPRPYRRVRYLGGSLLRLAYRVSLALPKAMRVGTPIGRWATDVGEWAYTHSHKCVCHSCQIVSDYNRQNATRRIGDLF